MEAVIATARPAWYKAHRLNPVSNEQNIPPERRH